MMPTIRLFVVFTLALVLLPGAATRAMTGEGGELLSVVELFTSQGCSSCPPADELFDRYARRDDVLALSFNVDYWDYLGWKDTLASPANSERQRAYRLAHGGRSIYTPQAVVNGLAPAPGYDAQAIDSAIEKTTAKLGGRVPLAIERDGDMLHVEVRDQPDRATTGTATVWLVLYSPEETVKIERGENAGRKITYHNVVREMLPIGTWNGSAVRIDLSKSDLMSRGHNGCAVLLQAGTAGPILGAAKLDRW